MSFSQQKSQAFTKQMSALLEAQQRAEEEYITARNDSLATSIGVIASIDESADKAKVTSLEANVKLENLAAEFKHEHGHQMNKIKEARTKAVEQLQTDQQVVSQGIARFY